MFYIGTNVASPTNEDGILDCPEQMQLTEIEGQWSSKPEPMSFTYLDCPRIFPIQGKVIRQTFSNIDQG